MTEEGYRAVLGTTNPFRKSIEALMQIEGLAEDDAKVVAAATPVLIAQGVDRVKAEELQTAYAAFGVNLTIGQGNIEPKAMAIQTLLTNHRLQGSKWPERQYGRAVGFGIFFLLLLLLQFYLHTNLLDKLIFGLGVVLCGGIAVSAKSRMKKERKSKDGSG